jgi:hypothetical protein
MSDRAASAPVEFDFIKAVADAWDGRGDNVLMLGEQRALWALTHMDPARLEPTMPRWAEIPPQDRMRLVLAMRRAISLGRVCQLLLS